MAKRTIYVSKKNPRMSLESLEKFGYTGKTPEEVLANVRRHYPKAKKGSGWHGEGRRHAEAARRARRRHPDTGEELAESYINGNISDVRERLKRASRKTLTAFIIALDERGKQGGEIAGRLLGV